MDLNHHQTFLNTTYRVLKSSFIDIKINQVTTRFSKLENWAFITPWNPLPHILSLKENHSRNQQLEEDIKELGLKYTLGSGISEDKLWVEESFLLKT